MAQLTADFEKGTSGNTIATTDVGSTSAWNAVTIGTGAGITYDNTQAAHGSLAGKIAVGATSGSSYLNWTLASPTDHYGRIYIYLSANPTSILPLMQCGTSGGGVRGARIDINTTGTLRTVDNVGVVTGSTSTNSLNLNGWTRIEYHVVHSATVGQIEYKIFLTPDSSTATETNTSAANLNTLASADGIRFGNQSGPTNYSFWLDDIAAAAAAYPGPAASSSSSSNLALAAGMGSFLNLKGIR